MVGSEFTLPVSRQLSLSGLLWECGDADADKAPPVLALHGWLDNAASFSHLAPRLGRTVYALDLPGHGRSPFKTMPGPYTDWDQIPLIDAVLDALAVDTAVLMGHSLGGVQAFQYAVAAPERTDRLVLLDALAPRPMRPQGPVEALRSGLRQWRRLRGRDMYRSPSRERLVRLRESSLSPDAAETLAARDLVQSDDARWRWSADRILYGAPLARYTLDQVYELLGALAVPTLLLVASSGRWREWVIDCAARLNSAEIQELEAGHHLHLEPESRDVAAERVSAFLREEHHD
ncbi:MAG: alpha/beta hydrolase [Gammaproteobacteria bacterium AqS3]|nr:alpha/beta hydrolase [Gammaproteobacteria bacterium AqS3]